MQFGASLNSNGATFGWLLYLDIFRIDTKVFMNLFFFRRCYYVLEVK